MSKKIARMMARRKQALLRVESPKMVLTCEDGPLKGHKLPLRYPQGPATLPLRVNGETGHYRVRHKEWSPPPKTAYWVAQS